MPIPASSESPPDEKIEQGQLDNQAPVDAKPPVESSPAEDADAKQPAPVKSTLDIVRDVVKAKPAQDSSDLKETSKPEGDSTAPEAKAPEADDKPPPFHAHPAWQRQLQRTREVEAKVKELEGPADQYRQVEQFMTTNNLAPDDIVRGFLIMAKVRNSPNAALAELRTVVGELEQQLGEVLPEDLQTAVEEGELTEERALELSRTRARVGMAEQTLTAKQEKERVEREAREAEQTRTQYAEAAQAWVAEKRGNDPDFDKVFPLAQDRIKATVAEMKRSGKAAFTPAEVRSITEQSYAYVKASLKPLIVPPPAPVNPLARRSQSSAPHAASVALPAKAPMLDVVKAALGAK